MFKVIRPEDPSKSQSYRNGLLRFLKVEQGFDLPLKAKDESSFILTENGKWNFSGLHGVFGGAVLYPQKISSHRELLPYDSREEKLGKLFSAFQPKGQEYWTARIFLYLEKNSQYSALETKEPIKQFYEKLYEVFKLLGAEKGFNYLTFTILLANTFDSLIYEVWPHLLRIELSDPSERFFHGILSLDGSKFKVRKIPSPVIPFPLLKSISFPKNSNPYIGSKVC